MKNDGETVGFPLHQRLCENQADSRVSFIKRLLVSSAVFVISRQSGEKLCSGACRVKSSGHAFQPLNSNIDFELASENSECARVPPWLQERGAVDRTLGLLEAL